MAPEKVGLHQNVPVVCTVPSSPEKGETRVSKETYITILGLVMGVGIIVAGFVAVVYILAPCRPCGEDHTSESHEYGTTAEKDALVNFDMAGKHHKELVSVANDGQLVTIVDDEDGFSVILDYKDGIAVVKNMSAKECYIFPIEKFPDYQTDDMESLKPVFVQTNGENPVKNTDDETSVTSLFKAGVIPWKFMKTTSHPTVAKSCMGSTSFWLEDVTTGVTESTRQKRSSCICWELKIYSDGSISFSAGYCDCLEAIEWVFEIFEK
ncbi:hypothetical protein HOLleu_15905 [Holothuria leucospilota]|uniref:BRICHOS domain-containing protein n=1 Tax=Holothuria leucospilota TaxID=206669 RepID=A0A9Q1C5D7_HOLLE|nr:hypothetical protein HOLleu_15905 [Holothuria leucospilota]